MEPKGDTFPEIEVQQKLLAARQSVKLAGLHPWESWALAPETSTTSQRDSNPDFSSSKMSKTTMISCPSTLSTSTQPPSDLSAISSSSGNISGVPMESVTTTSIKTSRTNSTISDSSGTFTNPLPANPSTSSAANIYSTTITITSNQTPGSNSGVVQIQADPATHGVLAASIISSVFVIFALSAVFAWWLVRRAKKGYRYGLMKETRRPMF